MTKDIVNACLAALLVGMLTSTARVVFAADDEPRIDGSVTLGAMTLDLDGEKQSKFEEFQDGLDDSLSLQDLWLSGTKGRLYFTVRGRDLSQRDQSVFAEGGLYGRFKARFSWDEIPHYFSTRGRFLGTSVRRDYWAVPDIDQQTLESDFPLGGNPTNTPTATGITNLQDLLARASNEDLRIERKTGRINLAYNLLPNLTIRTGYMHENREGQRALSSGAYRRDSDGAPLVGGVGENFTLYGLEFPEPIEYKTDELSLGFDYRGAGWHMDFSYEFTSFRNQIDDVTWDNPLLFTGVDDTQGGSPINRLDLFPDSRSHALSLTAGIFDLPLHSKLTATLAWGRVTQDDDFLPYTINPALTVDADGVTSGADLALPASNLDGEVDTTVVNAVLSSHPIKPLSLTFKVSYYNYDNRSKEISWTDGWARIGESLWSADSIDGVINRVPEYERIRSKFDAAYRINKMLTLRTDYTNEIYNRNESRNADTIEHIFGGGFKLLPCEQATLRLSYHRSMRDIDGSYINNIGKGSSSPGSHEWEELRMFDQADRDRDTVDVFLGLEPMENLSLDLTFQYNDDDYESKYYGLQDHSGYLAGLDFSYMILEQVTLFGYYSREDYNSKMLNRAKSDSAGGGSFAVPENDFATDIDDTTDTVGGGVSVELIPGKLSFKLSADYSNAVGEYETSNPSFLSGTTTSSAIGFDWPDLKTRTTEVRADLEHHWTENLAVGIHYLYRTLKFDDFAWDSLVPYGNTSDTQGNSLDYFMFMDSNYSDYRAHFLMGTISYTF